MVDGFRAYAILGVVVLHLLLLSGAVEQGTADSLIAWGLLGNIIDIFFIISGFALFLPVVIRNGELGPIRNFAVGRAARLLPAYWLSLAMLLALIALYPTDIGRGVGPQVQIPGVAEVLAQMAALQMPIRLFDGTFPIGFGLNGALWLLSIIVGFYVVFPFIAKSYYRRPLIGLAIAAAITFGWKLFVQEVPGFFRWLDQSDTLVVSLNASDQLPGWAFSFALGMTGAWAYVRALRGGPLDRFQRQAVWAAAGALIAYAICAYLYGRSASEAPGAAIGGTVARSSPELVIAYSLSRAALLAAIALAPFWLRAPFDNAPVRKVAEFSYGIYLIHLVVCAYVCSALLGLPTDGSLKAVTSWFGVAVAVSVAYAWVSLRYVEAPFRRRARRQIKERQQAQDGVPEPSGSGRAAPAHPARS